MIISDSVEIFSSFKMSLRSSFKSFIFKSVFADATISSGFTPNFDKLEINILYKVVLPLPAGPGILIKLVIICFGRASLLSLYLFPNYLMYVEYNLGFSTPIIDCSTAFIWSYLG